MTRQEEQKLVERAARGDTAAFEEIVRANEKMVYNLALRSLGNREDAEDAAQEVFMKAYAALATMRGDSKLSVWLYRITNNVCIDMLRRRRDTLSLSCETEDGESEFDLPDSRFDPAAIAERRDLREQVSRALAQLPDDARQIFLLRELAGQSYAEIAETLQIDIGTVKSRIFRARKRICLLLSGNISEESSSKRSEGGVQI
ncbi:MAG: sigma-70 family RNA polymerase sigma factor [Ruminococcaceae bacterium]|nr:sigma-70 family RNA polymerase sigma factor [Oscillospiraceae bacterium]